MAEKAMLWGGLALLLVSLSGAPAAVAQETFTEVECASFYLGFQWPFFDNPKSAEGARLGMEQSFNWANERLKQAPEEEVNAAMAKLREQAGKLTQPMIGDFDRPKVDVFTLTDPVVALYDPPCHELTGRPHVDLRALAKLVGAM